MKKIIIYKLCFPNGKCYIGQTVSITDRMCAHGKSDYPVGNAIRKYGHDNIRIEILHTVYSRKEANKLEVKEILNYNCICPNGYNLTTGGCVGKEVCEESKQKMRGNKNPLGHKHTKETKRKMSIAAKGNQRALGFKHTEETKQKISRAQKGNANCRGRKQSKAERKRKSDAMKAYWVKKKMVA